MTWKLAKRPTKAALIKVESIKGHPSQKVDGDFEFLVEPILGNSNGAGLSGTRESGETDTTNLFVFRDLFNKTENTFIQKITEWTISLCLCSILGTKFDVIIN